MGVGAADHVSEAERGYVWRRLLRQASLLVCRCDLVRRRADGQRLSGRCQRRHKDGNEGQMSATTHD
jgi:hypothetical protein